MEAEITFTGIAGILPAESTFSDVIRRLGSNYKVDQIASRRSKNRILPDKSLLRFHDLNVTVVFIDPGFKLFPQTRVSVIGAEMGCTFQTENGLCVGMSLPDAIAIIDRSYTILEQSSYCIEAVSFDGQSTTFLGLHHDEGQIQFIGLYQRKPLFAR